MENKEIVEKDIQDAIDEYLKNVAPIFDNFIKRAQKPIDERTVFCILGQEHINHLLISKFDLVKIPIRLLRRLPIYLIKQFEIQVEIDSLFFWALTHDVVSRNYDLLDRWPLRNEFLVFMATHFAKLKPLREFSPGPPNFESASSQLDRIIDIVVSQPVKDIIENKEIITRYLCYPLLENLVKFALNPLIDLNGFVQQKFNDGQRDRNINERISSLAKLLRSLEKNASKILSNPELGIDLRDFRVQTEKLIPKEKKNNDGWDSIYKIRSTYLHGAGGWQLRTGLLTNLICMLIWYLMEDEDINKILHEKAMEPKHWRFPDEYYPPRLF